MPRRLLLLVPLVLLAGACSGSDGSSSHAASTSTSTSSSTTSTTDAPTSTLATTTSTTTAGAATTAHTAPTSTTTPPGSGIPMTGPTGSGTVTWKASPERSELCYRITVRGIGAPSEASLRRPTGESVLTLQAPPTDGTVNSCSASDALTVEELQTHPGNFAIQVVGAKGTLKATLR